MDIEWDNIKTPKKVKNCPILEAIIELRFVSSKEDAIVGLIHSKIEGNYPKIERTPIADLPRNIIENDINLKFKPLFKLAHKTNTFTILVGPRVITLSILSQYPGWEMISKEMSKITAILDDLKIVEKYTRIGLRYINSFDENILPNTNISLGLHDKTMRHYEEISLKLNIPTKDFTRKLLIANNARISSIPKEKSIIDIDVSMKNPDKNTLLSFINEAHQLEKNVFYKRNGKFCR